MPRKAITAAIMVSLATLFVGQTSASSRYISRYDARRGAVILPNGKAMALSGIWRSALDPKRQARKLRSVRSAANAAVPGAALVTHIQGPFAANGPAIAVDPNDPAHLIASANDYRIGGTPAFALYSSRDGGMSWNDYIGQYVQSYPYFFGVSGDAAVAIDSNSIDYFQTVSLNVPHGASTDNSNAVVVARSTPLEADIFVDNAPVAINYLGPTATSMNEKDALAVDILAGSAYKGSLYSVWTLVDPVNSVSPIVEAYSRDLATTFSANVLVSQPGSAALCNDGGLCRNNQGASPVVGPNGTVFVAYENYNTPAGPNQILMSASRDGGQTFGAPVKVADDYDIVGHNPYHSFQVNSFPNLAINQATGQLYVAWADLRDGSSEIYVTTSTDRGLTWSAPRSVATPVYGAFRFFPAVGVQASTGDVYISYYDNIQFPTRDIYGYFYRKGSANLKPLIPSTLVSATPIIPGVASSDFFGDYTRLATSPLGANVIWTGTQFGDQDIESALVP